MLRRHKKDQPPAGRRGRLTDPAPRANQMYSYRAHRAVRLEETSRMLKDDEPDEATRARQAALKPKRLKAVVYGVLIIAIAVLSLRLDTQHIKVVTVVSGKTPLSLHSDETYRQAAVAAFHGPLNTNKLTVSTGAIEAELRRQFPELMAVSVTLPLVGSHPVVYIQPAAPKLILVSSNGLYLLDSNGRALMAGNQVSKLDGLQVPVVNDESGLPVRLGRIALPESSVSFITEVAAQMRAKGLKVTSLALPAGTAELHMRLDGAGYLVKYNLHGDAREEAGAFLAVKDRLEADHKTPHEYVDVRVENKAYYK